MSQRKCNPQGGENNLQPRREHRRRAQAVNNRGSGKYLPLCKKSSVHGVLRRFRHEPCGPPIGEVQKNLVVRPQGLQIGPDGTYWGGSPNWCIFTTGVRRDLVCIGQEYAVHIGTNREDGISCRQQDRYILPCIELVEQENNYRKDVGHI